MSWAERGKKYDRIPSSRTVFYRESKEAIEVAVVCKGCIANRTDLNDHLANVHGEGEEVRGERSTRPLLEKKVRSCQRNRHNRLEYVQSEMIRG